MNLRNKEGEKMNIKIKIIFFLMLLPNILICAITREGVLSNAQSYSNFGWIVTTKNKQYVSHWWDQDWDWKMHEDRIVITGFLVPHVEQESTPFKHIILRIISFLFGNRIISKLKNQLIFKAKKSRFLFNRSIEFNDDSIVINDSIDGVKKDDFVVMAPRSSKRHVASADSYHEEDFLLNRGFKVTEQNQISNNIFESKMTVTPAE